MKKNERMRNEDEVVEVDSSTSVHVILILVGVEVGGSLLVFGVWRGVVWVVGGTIIHREEFCENGGNTKRAKKWRERG